MSTTFPIDVTPTRLVEFFGTTRAVCLAEIGRDPFSGKPFNLADTVGGICVFMMMEGETGAQVQEWLHNTPEAIAFRSQPAPLPFAPFKGAFCIPNVLPGIPFGDGKRIWTPAFSCYRSTPWQDAMLAELVKRGHTWIEIQLSGNPYRGDYPEIALDIPGLIADLVKIRKAGLRSIAAFRDDVGPDCSYLKDAAAATQDLVDCVMGIYESNGVFNWDENVVASVLQQQKQLWPKAINAFHSTSQDNGGRGFGESTFWNRVAPFTDVYFMQQSGWSHTVADTANRFSDFAFRLNNGNNGWPKLKYGVVEFELTTSMTYRTWTEQQGIDMMTQVFAACTTKPTGYMDGGTPNLVA